MNIFLRKARLKDAVFIYNLKTSKEVIKTSIDRKKIKFKNHKIWLKKKLKDKNSLFFLINENRGKLKVGYVRLDFEGFYYRVTIAIIKNKTRLNYAHNALKEVEKKIHSSKVLFAQVIKSNIKSVKLFKKANYIEIGSEKKIKFFFKFLGKNE